MHQATIYCDIKNVSDEYEDDDIEAIPITYYPCSVCNEKFEDFDFDSEWSLCYKLYSYCVPKLFFQVISA